MQEKAAETIIKVIDDARRSGFANLATKEDIRNIEIKFKEEISDVKIQLAKVIENMNMIKWLCVGILIPIVAASVKVLFSTMFGS